MCNDSMKFWMNVWTTCNGYERASTVSVRLFQIESMRLTFFSASGVAVPIDAFARWNAPSSSSTGLEFAKVGSLATPVPSLSNMHPKRRTLAQN
jgi:hypothetical protein